MSVSFYGLTPKSEPIMLDFDDPAQLQLANGNARSFLLFMGLDPGEHLDGHASLPEVRRAVMRARATLDRRAPKFTRAGSDTKHIGACRVIVGGIDEDYLARRLADFERFVDAVVELGAASIYWG